MFFHLRGGYSPLGGLLGFGGPATRWSAEGAPPAESAKECPTPATREPTALLPTRRSNPRVCVCRLRESGSALPQQPAPCGAVAGTTSLHNSPTRSCPHARRHLVGHACSPASSFWSGPSTPAPCVGPSPRVRTPWSHVFLITSMVYRCVLSYVVSLIWSALVFLVSCWCGLVLSARVNPVWSSLVFPMP